MERPHVVMLSAPGQGHINPMLKLADILHSKGFFITFVTTDHTHQKVLASQGPDALQGFVGFRFEIIPDGVSLPSSGSQEHVVKWCLVTYENCVAPFKDLLMRLNNSTGVPKITCVVYNWLMTFALHVAEELRIPAFVFMTMSACGFIGSLYLDDLIQRGYTPLKDESQLTNGYLDTPVDFLPGLKDIRLRDLPSFIRTVDADGLIFKFGKVASEKCLEAKGLILNTFDLLETDVLNVLNSMFQKVYTIGPLLSHIVTGPTKSLCLNLWKEEDHGYMEWLDQQRPSSVIYVNFGSLITITTEELIEFAWGLANSNHPFLWVIRPDLVEGHCDILPKGFIDKTKDRSYLLSWCAQEEVISHNSIGGFLTHCGWNSTLESVNSGVPMICWPRFDDQCTNARYICKQWGTGIEIDEDVQREQVTGKLKELMEGDKGKEMRKNVIHWKQRAKSATIQGGSSYENIVRLTMDITRIFS
ncbi:uncharacterized protein A4U43_C03F2660 [Asparagus officinalis]|uniref:Glycosyltransferase n=1 Tax=Asparagus officinalis TaxID=4686 RepID=A0A5P1FB92_ASPOF|nr:7-deoxyloganetin glucosyltransferase-like [Asparagus officinalis]ONK74089.1 uncharacterized protein A4U43_C03F2660 [Asparagus officinalis]